MTKRLVFVDFMRGLGIFYMIILHAFLFRVVHQFKPLFEKIMSPDTHIMARIVAAPFIFFSLWGSLFCMIGGIVFVYRARMEYESNEKFQPKAYFLRRGLSGLVLILIQYIWLTFLSPKSTEHPGPSTYSLLTGTLEQWGFSSFNILHYSTTGLIESLGWTIIVLSILSYFVLRKKTNSNLRFYLVFGAGFLVAIAVSIGLEIWIENPSTFFDQLYTEGKIFQIIILLKLTSNRFSIFPLIVFGISGAFIGYKLVNISKDRSMIITLFTIGGVCILGFIIIFLLGFDMMEGYTNSYTPLPLHLLNFGGQCIFIVSFYLIFRNYQKSQRERDLGIVRFINMFNRTSLTVYFLEPLTSVILFLIVQSLFYKPISEEFFVWTGFLVLNAVVWYGILALWRTKKYMLSIEWMLEKIRGKKKRTIKSSQLSSR